MAIPLAEGIYRRQSGDRWRGVSSAEIKGGLKHDWQFDIGTNFGSHVLRSRRCHCRAVKEILAAAKHSFCFCHLVDIDY